MSQLPNINPAFGSGQQFGAADALNDVDLDDFLQLMIAELQNQDPLNPLENDELLAQISQIREVGATEQLTETLSAVLLGQNIASATTLIGSEVDGLSDQGERVTGVVNRISIEDGAPSIHLDFGSQANLAEEPGSIEEGEYIYKVVFEETDTSGERKQFSIDLGDFDSAAGGVNAPVRVSRDGAAIRLSHLPTTSGPKSIYRADKSRPDDFRLVTVITDGRAASFVDSTKTGDLSTARLTGSTLPIQGRRAHQLSLSNISEIRPPQ